MRRTAMLVWATAIPLLVGCASGNDAPINDNTASAAGDTPPAAPPMVQSMVPQRNITALGEAASWSGRIPCADCEYIETAVTLYPEGEFRSQGVYHGARGTGDTVFTDFGRWTHSSDGTRISVRGSANVPGQFSVSSQGALRMLDPSGNEIISPLNYTLTAVEPLVTIVHPTRLIGAFATTSTGATFTECGSGVQYPVSPTANYNAALTAYRQQGVAAGTPVPMRVRAHLADGPTGAPAERTVVIDSLARVEPEAGCAALSVGTQLSGEPWRLVLVRGPDGTLAVPPTSEAEFSWDGATKRLTGNAGCNRVTGSATLEGTRLVAGAVAATRRQCVDEALMTLEDQLLAWLGAPLALRIDADTLVWQHGPADVARFVRGQ